MRRTLFLPLLLGTSLAVHATSAQEEEANRLALARRYIELLCAKDTADATRLLAPDAEYVDPTAAGLSGKERRLRGRAEIVAHFAESGASKTAVTIRRAFSAGSLVVLELDYRANVYAGFEEAASSTSGFSSLAVLTIVADQITRHVEYVGYDDLLRGVGAPVDEERASAVQARSARHVKRLHDGSIAEMDPELAENVSYRADDGPPRSERTAVLADWRERFSSPAAVEIERAFTSGEYCVLSLRLVPADGGAPRHVASVVRLEDDRVVEQLDFFEPRSGE